MYRLWVLSLLLLCMNTGYAQSRDAVAVYDSLVARYAVDGPFTFLEAAPSYPFSPKKLRKFVASHTFFPRGKEDVSGKVVLRFDIEEDGKIGAIKVLRSLHPSLDSVAVAMIRQMPRWKPAIYNGRPVKWFYYFPVFFPAR